MPEQLCLRWSGRRGSLRPASELIRPAEYEVHALAGDTEAKAFVLAHHYAGTYPAARWRFGLYRRAALVGVAVFSHPSNDQVLTNVFPGAARDSVELGRLVLLDSVPGNGESWFVARCLAQLRREGLAGVVSFSDPIPRATAAGHCVMPGHVGVVYQASNARYLLRSTPRVLRLLPDGRVFSARTAQKVRALERGWEHAAAQLEAAGAARLEGDPRAWLATWLPRVTRPLRHPGNHRYAFPLSRATARAIGAGHAYPSTVIARAA